MAAESGADALYSFLESRDVNIDTEFMKKEKVNFQSNLLFKK